MSGAESSGAPRDRNSSTGVPESAPLGALWRAALATRERWRLLVVSVALGTLAVLAAVALLTTAGYLISRAAERPPILALTLAIVGVRFFGIARALLRYLERLTSHDLAFRTLGDLRRRFFHRLIPLVPGALGSESRAELLSRFVADVDRLQDLYLRALIPPLVAIGASLGALALAAFLWPAAAAVLAAFLLVTALLVPALTRAAARSAGRHQAPARAQLSANVIEIVGGASEIAVAGREADWIDGAERSGRRLARIQVRDALAGGLGTGLGTALAAAATVAVAAVAIPAVADGALAGLLLAALVLLAMGSFEAVDPLPVAAASVDACATAAARLEELTEREPAIVDPPTTVPLPASGSLQMRGVSFRYAPDSPWIVEDVDLNLEPGQAIALLGSSGAGKTTLAELAVRFLDPERGAVSIGGLDLREAAQEEVRETVRLSPQDAYLFAASIRANLAIARPDAGEAQMREAIERVGLAPWLASLPDGLDTEVGERGAQVSGGERQRIATARLLLSEARFLILDEPTAHLDEAGARRLLAELATDARRSGRGALVVTHEPVGLEEFDEVLTLGRGGVT
jgi:thiol reductant ABC exporter CydC subunit